MCVCGDYAPLQLFAPEPYREQPAAAVYRDFIIAARDVGGRDVMWLAKTKDETRRNTAPKSDAARLWCEKMSQFLSIDYSGAQNN
jgi:hypothetical protein